MKKFILIFLILPLFSVAETKYYNASFVNNAPKIDGVLVDQCWVTGEWEGDFVQFEPNAGLAPSQQTQFKIFYDDNNVYVAIRCFDDETKKINKQLSRRDAGLGDLVAVSFDSYYDKRTAFFFGVSAAGVKNDIVFTDDGNSQDETWDPVWYVKTNVDSLGWTAEMRIPLSQLRFNPSSEVWGLNFMRQVYRNNEVSFWHEIDPSASGWISQFGEMHGMDKLNPKKNIEISPYFVSGIKRYEKEDGNPYMSGYDFLKNAGLDGKIGITNDFILDFTVNPDFGQVEADPSNVNLSAFETYYSEKRPFFIENKNITQFPIGWKNESLFYTRRIGRNPHGEPQVSDGEYFKVPKNTRILGALKFSGKSQNGWSIGVIESITNRQYAKIMQVDGVERKESVEPLTNYFVARVQKDLNKGNSVLGVILTSTYRDINNTNLDFLNKTATTGGIDFIQYFNDKKFFIKGSSVFSHITGSTTAILDQQMSSARYFQRTDNDYVSIDSNATSMTGTYANLSIGKSGLKGLTYALSLWYRSPSLETNDIGYLQNADFMTEIFWINYQTPKSFGIINSFNANFSQWYFIDNGFNYLHSGFNVNFGTQFTNFWSIHMVVDYNFSGVTNDLLRGGPSFAEPRQAFAFFYASTNQRLKLSSSVYAHLQNSGFSYQNGTDFGGEIQYRPFDKFNMSIEAGYGNTKKLLQYYDEFDYNQSYYLFSSLNQKTFNLTFRFEVNFSPDLTLQFYGAPFVSAADFYDYKFVTDSRASLFYDRFSMLGSDIYNSQEYSIDIDQDNSPDYSFSNPNFNFRQFRSNLVLRWEYIPGSVLFVVWAHEQSSVDETADFNLGSDMKSLFRVFPTDILLLKFQYRFL